MLTLELPYPPSVNHYWKTRGKGRYLCKKAKTFREQVGLVVRFSYLEKMLGPLHMEVDLHPRDGRRRDVDNALKALLDSLQHAGLYDDDFQIQKLTIERLGCVPGGKAVVRVKEAS